MPTTSRPPLVPAHVRGDTDSPSAPAAVAVAPRATVIVPAYNEEGGLAAVLNELRDQLDDRIEILVVDDGSTDRTAAVAEASGARLVRHSRNRGKGAALRTGLEHAAGERIVVIDADGTYPVREIPRMLELLDSHDLVLGARRVGRANIPRLNRLGNAALSTGIRTLSGLRARDPLTGLYAAWRHHLHAMELRSEGFGIETEITMKSAAMGLLTADHAIPYGSRVGHTKLRPLRDGTAIALTMGRLALARLLRRRPRASRD